MGKRLREYLLYADEATSKELSTEDKETLRRQLLVQIQFFQHERLIHLIVTITFALMTVITLVGSIITEEISLLLLIALFIILLIPYIRHYYLLENGVQKLYTFYDRIQ